MKQRNRVAQQSGVALIAVLWVLALMTLMGASVATSVRTETAVSRNLVQALVARQAGEGAVQLAVLHLLRLTTDEQWRSDGTAYPVRVGATEVRVRIWDEAGKIDLNAAPVELLQGLFRAVSVDQDTADRLADAVLDWRDADDLRRLHGAEDGDYAAAGLPYGAKDARFDTVGELRLVLGITPEIFDAVRGAVTVYHRHAWVNPAAASREVLLAIPGVHADGVDNYLQERRFSLEGGESLPAPPFPSQAFVANVAGSTYTVVAQTVAEGEATNEVAAVIRVNRADRQRPFEILRWGYVE